MKNKQNNTDLNCGQYAIVHLNQIKNLNGLSGADVLVYLVLLSHKNKSTGLAYPSTQTIQRHTELSRSSVMRSIRRLKSEDVHLIKEEKTMHAGVKAYSFATSVNIDTSANLDTSVNIDTSTSANLDTTPVSDLTPKQVSRTEEENNILTVRTLADDESLFLLLWQKWNKHNLCQWSSVTTPIEDYRTARQIALSNLHQKQIKKDLCLELQVIDIFIMQQWIKENGAKPYAGVARVWSGQRWISGLSKWLSSETASYINAERAKFKPHMITLSKAHHDQTSDHAIAGAEEHTEDDVRTKDGCKVVEEYKKRLTDIYEAFEIHEDESTLKDAVDWLMQEMQAMLTPDQIEAVKQQTKTGTNNV